MINIKLQKIYKTNAWGQNWPNGTLWCRKSFWHFKINCVGPAKPSLSQQPSYLAEGGGGGKVGRFQTATYGSFVYYNLKKRVKRVNIN